MEQIEILDVKTSKHSNAMSSWYYSRDWQSVENVDEEEQHIHPSIEIHVKKERLATRETNHTQLRFRNSAYIIFLISF